PGSRGSSRHAAKNAAASRSSRASHGDAAIASALARVMYRTVPATRPPARKRSRRATRSESGVTLPKLLLACSIFTGGTCPLALLRQGRCQMAELVRRVGLGLAARGDVEDTIEWVRRARDAGLESVWFHDSYFERDAVTYATAVASKVDGIR